jgi:hypothetical protein
MANKTLLDLITKPVVRRLVLHLGTALVSSILTMAVNQGWIDQATTSVLSDALITLVTNLADFIQ